MLHNNVRVTLAYTALSTVAGSIALGSVRVCLMFLDRGGFCGEYGGGPSGTMGVTHTTSY